MSTLEKRRAYQERERALIARFAPAVAAAIAAEPLCPSASLVCEESCWWVEADLRSSCAAKDACAGAAR